MESEGSLERKPKFLCLHGFRTSSEIFKKQLAKWPQLVLEKLDLVYLDAPFPALGPSQVEGFFNPPYYEWFQFNKDFTKYTNLDECLTYIEDYMIEYGPFDGFIGFSQGAILAAALAGLQSKGWALTKVAKIKFVIVIGGATLKDPSLAEKAYASLIHCPSIHFIGETDYFLGEYGIKLSELFVDPLVIHHPMGHIIPRLDDKSMPSVLSFIERIHKIVNCQEEVSEVVKRS